MKIQILISEKSWANKYKSVIKNKLKNFSRTIRFLDNHKKLKKQYDINIIFSYFKKIPKEHLSFSKYNLIPHESNLPKGKGMSPLTWQILEKKDKVFFSLIEAGIEIDGGPIYYQKKVKIKKDLLFQEIKEVQLLVNLALIDRFLKYFKKNKTAPNSIKKFGKETFYKKRTQKDSELNVNDTLKNLFNLIRVSDFENYPAFFKLFGKKYKLKISKI